MDVDAMRIEFVDRGVVRLDRAFSHETAERMRAAVAGHLERRLGVRLADRSTWPEGWLPISWKNLKRNRAFDAPIDSPAVTAALDTIFGAAGWQPPRPGAQVLFDLPRPEQWTLPDGWHMDCGFEQPVWPVPAVKLFAFFGEVGPRGGGTMLLPGSHRLVDRYRSTFDEPPGGGKERWQPFLRRHPPLGDLLRGAAMPDLGRSLVGSRHEVDGVPVDVVELTGQPGDVVITHLNVFHAGSPNTSDRPRQMLGKAVFSARPE